MVTIRHVFHDAFGGDLLVVSVGGQRRIAGRPLKGLSIRHNAKLSGIIFSRRV